MFVESTEPRCTEKVSKTIDIIGAIVEMERTMPSISSTRLCGSISIEIGSINVHMLKLRRKIGEQYFETVRGLGYKLVNPEES
nr:MAG: hypothetical protein DIU81_08285 [[Clostridium] cellulosi]